MNSNFKPEEIVKFERYNKKLKKNVETSFPIVGGRLRLFHEDLAKSDSSQVAGGIDIEIIDRDREYALVKARVCIDGNAFTGIGMASKSRDSMIFPAIMEMAETRAIARALRFAGYGVEYTGAEEMQGVKNFDDSQRQDTREPSDVNTSRDVNDGMPEEETSGETSGEPSLKRQVWELVTKLYPSVQENYLADAVFSFVSTTMAKYEDGDAETVYKMVIDNQDRFAGAFGKFVKDAIPDIKSPGVVPEEKKVVIEPTPEGGDSEIQKKYQEERKEFLDATSGSAEKDPGIELKHEGGDSEIQKEHSRSMKAGADNMKIDPPAPAVDAGKVAKANIYRAMPDGISVAALNGTLAHLIKENEDYKASDIYSMVLDDIDGFMVMLKNWCSNNDVPSGLEPKTEAPAKLKKIEANEPDKKSTITGREFRKSWVRLDLENFNKFIIQNCDTFKEDREEYNAAVEKYDRLKAKSKDTENLVFPYLFSQDDAVKPEPKPHLTTENSILNEELIGEENIMEKYCLMFPDLSKKISEAMGINLTTGSLPEALKFNKKIEELLTEYENEHKKAYTEA
jgi:hypothetical protein